MRDLIGKLRDLHKQATVERSHYYVGKYVEQAITEIVALTARAELAETECLEQARLNGMGSEREAALLARVGAEEAARKKAEQDKKALAEMLLLYVQTVPLGHQPHMSAEKAEIIARAALGE